MGGILAMDALRLAEQDESRPPLLNLKGIIPIDTPYFGLSSSVFNPIQDVVKTVTSSGWGMFAVGAVALGVAAFASSLDNPRVKDHLNSLKQYGSETYEFLQPLAHISDQHVRFDILKVLYYLSKNAIVLDLSILFILFT